MQQKFIKNATGNLLQSAIILLQKVVVVSASVRSAQRNCCSDNFRTFSVEDTCDGVPVT